MKTLILPAEIKSREMDARLLHSVLALERGWRVITGSKALINRSIWRLPRGVYLNQTMTHKRLFMARYLKHLGFAIQGWDEEGLVYLDRDLYLTRRISSETLSFIDQIFSWGEKSAEDINSRAAAIGRTARALGNPRFDLLRPELRGLYKEEVEAIGKAHGGFILVNTNFSSVNPVISMHDTPERAISRRDKPKDGHIAAQYDGFLGHRNKMFEAFCDLIPQLAAAFRARKIIIRPHPAEEMQSWRDIAGGYDNVEVIRQGPSIPWLMAADILVHNGCTTAIETRLMGKAPVAYTPFVSPEHEAELPNGISHCVKNVEELIATLKQGLEGELVFSADQKDMLDHYISGVGGPLAAQQAVEAADEITPQAGRWISGLHPLSRLFGALREGYKLTRRNHRTDRYLDKVFPETEADEISDRARQIAALLGLACADKIRVRRLRPNIFELTAG